MWVSREYKTPLYIPTLAKSFNFLQAMHIFHASRCIYKRKTGIFSNAIVRLIFVNINK